MPTDPDQKFREAVRHVRYDNVHVGEPDHESVSICGNASLEQLETVLVAYRAWYDATVYKPEDEADNANQ